jgi:diguanylate cyclase (GGDEF)-like protein
MLGTLGLGPVAGASTTKPAADWGPPGGQASGAAPGSTPSPLDEPHFDRVGVEAIPRGVIATLAQDRDGFLWLATGDGLVRWDGYRFQPREAETDDLAARNLGWIRALLPGRDGRLWIGTENRGVALHDPAADRTRYLGQDADGRAPGGLPTVMALAEDAAGAIWVGSLGGGLQQLDAAGAEQRRWRAGSEPGALPDDRVLALAVDPAGGVWVGTWRGLVRLRPDGTGFDPVLVLGAGDAARRSVQVLRVSDDGTVWAGTREGDLLRFDAAAAGAAAPAPGQLLRRGSATGAVTALAEAPVGRLWVGRTGGIDVHDVSTGKPLRSVRHDPRHATGLAADEVTALLRDREGWLWVGGLGLGLQRHHPGPVALRVRAADEAIFPSGNARSLLVWRAPNETGTPAPGAVGRGDTHDAAAARGREQGREEGREEIWVGTPADGVAVFDTALRGLGRLSGPGAPSGRVEAMAQTPDGTAWLAGDGSLMAVGPDRRVRRRLPLAAGTVHRLVATRDGSLWVCAQAGLFHLPAGGDELKPVLMAEGRPSPGEFFVLAEGPDGRVWAGGTTGLYRVRMPAAPGAADPASAPRSRAGETHGSASPPAWVSSPVLVQPGGDLGGAIVLGLLFDRAGQLWLDTAVAGLHRLLPPDDPAPAGPDRSEPPLRFERISLRHGILNRPYGVNLLQDGRGRIWTQQYVYDPAHDRIDELTVADGRHFGTGWFHSYAQLADGRMLFGGSRGVLVVEPERFESSSTPVPLVVTGLRVNGQPRPAAVRAGLVVHPDERSFGLEFAALDYVDPMRLRYAHRLEGFDPDWIDTGAEFRSASYSNLNPGNYLLRVRATNRSGVWSEHELAIPVQVLPAWWQNRGLLALALVLGVALLYGALHWRLRALHRRQQWLRRQVDERTLALQHLNDRLQAESVALRESSLTDPLTGLRNRRFFLQHIDADVAAAVRRWEDHARHGGPPPEDADLLLFVIDIDHFKQVNDRHGHEAGDAVIQQMRGRLQRVFRDSDHLVRWGGEEFLVAARGTDRRHAAALARRACEAVSGEAFELPGGQALNCSCSIGFAPLPLVPALPRALDWSATVNLADAALFDAKTRGRNSYSGVLGAAQADPAVLAERCAAGDWMGWLASGALDVERAERPPPNVAQEPH